MSFGASLDDGEIMSEINMTPLVDVMLVLLIIFMITMPVIQHSVQLNLPHAANRVNDSRPPHINLSILKNGDVRWDGKPIAMADLDARFSAASAKHPQPEVHLYADRETAYGRVAQAMAAAQASGMAKIGFITDPKSHP
jgi:biopolymer transport protein ExbD